MSATAARPPTTPHARGDGAWAALLAIVLVLVAARALSFTMADERAGEQSLGVLAVGTLHILATLLPPVLALGLVLRHGPARPGPRLAWWLLALLLGTAAGLALRVGLIVWASPREPSLTQLASLLRSVGPRTLVLGALAAVALELWRLADESEAAARHARADQAALERELAASRLQLLQAQVEPHFLFNTLANVRRLLAVDAAQGQAMLDSLSHYLSTALPSLRRATTPLGQEVALAVAWLRLQQMRMGARLAYRCEVPPALQARPVPPMMLLTLLENAVKHGLQPRARGGCVRLEARDDDGVLCLAVVDDGVGLRPGAGGGMGLANVRARLAAQYGPPATLSLEPEPGGGTRATLRLPAAPAPREGDA